MSYPFVERHGIDAFGHHHPLQRSDGCVQERPQGSSLLPAELGQRFAVPATLEDQLTRVGVGPGVMADEPEAVIEYHAAWSRDLARNLGAGAATGDEQWRRCHAPRTIPSLRIQTFAAKNSRIIVLWSSAATRTIRSSPSLPFVVLTLSFFRMRPLSLSNQRGS